MTKTLLAVEDSKTMRKVLGITFASEEFETVLVDSAQDGLAKLEQLRPDLALVDATLADLSGYDLCRRLKSRAPGMPVMLLSSRQQPYDPVRGADAGVDDFIDKPFDTQQIRDKVAKLVAKNGAVARPAAAPERTSAPPVPPRAPAPASPAAARAPQNPPQGPPPRPSLQAGADRRGAEPARAAPGNTHAGSAHAAGASASSVSASLRAVAGAAPAGVANDAGDGVANGVSGALMERLQGLDLTAEQVSAVLSISREVIERVVWEVVPVLAETLIKEEIARLTRE